MHSCLAMVRAPPCYGALVSSSCCVRIHRLDGPSLSCTSVRCSSRTTAEVSYYVWGRPYSIDNTLVVTEFLFSIVVVLPRISYAHFPLTLLRVMPIFGQSLAKIT